MLDSACSRPKKMMQCHHMSSLWSSGSQFDTSSWLEGKGEEAPAMPRNHPYGVPRLMLSLS